MAKVKELYVYPVKSCAAVPLRKARLVDGGIEHDRAWALVAQNGRLLTQRDNPRLALIQPQIGADGSLTLKAPDRAPIVVAAKAPAKATGRSSVDVWGEMCGGIDAGDEAAAWLSDFVEIPCRLVRSDADKLRRKDYQFLKGGQAAVAFADLCPLLIMCSESLDELNGRLSEPVPMSRFRPSIVIEGFGRFAEDTTKRFAVGKVNLHHVKPCGRCVIITIDQENGVADGNEVWTTLMSYRMGANDKVMFGAYFSAEGNGEICVGDELTREAN